MWLTLIEFGQMKVTMPSWLVCKEIQVINLSRQFDMIFLKIGAPERGV
eukprot:SAG11_NODE_2980_length_2794_cov_7.536549_1_plen_47_part_10